MSGIELLLMSDRGRYIPQYFTENFDLEKWGLDPDSWEVETCLKGPDDNDEYWEAWEEILNNAEYKVSKGLDIAVYRLHQDGDLWAIDYDRMTDEEKHNFGFED